jgi:hypothetical protein
MVAQGVARPNAHGHATTTTAMADMQAKTMRSCTNTRRFNTILRKKVTPAKHTITGAKDTGYLVGIGLNRSLVWLEPLVNSEGLGQSHVAHV